LALILFFRPFFPAGITSSSRAIASYCIPSIIWEYVSIVKATELCPRASLITFGLAPRSNIRLAKVCLRSWKRTPSSPAFMTVLVKAWVRTQGSIGLPSTLAKTRSSKVSAFLTHYKAIHALFIFS